MPSLLKEAYSVAEVAALMGVNRMTVTRLFENERGVIVLSRPEQKHKRRYRSLRIPRAVYMRVLERLSVR